MDWATIRSQLQTTVSELTGIRLGNVVWFGSFGSVSVNIDTQALLKIDSITSVGIDEVRYTPPPRVGEQQIAVMVGQRRFTLSIKISSQNQEPTMTARYIADKLRIRLHRPSVIADFAAVGIGVSSIAGTTQFDSFAGGRITTTSVLDVYMLAGDIDVDDTVGSGDWIGEVIANGDTVDSVGGVPVSPQPHIVADARDA